MHERSEPNYPIKVMIVQNHSITRHGLRAILSSEEQIEVTGEAGDGWSALKIIKADRPDVVLLDTNLPKLNGIDMAKLVLQRQMGTKILFLCSDASSENVLEALKAGASGYLLKNCEQSDLLLAIKCVAQGHGYLSPAITTNVIRSYVKGADHPEPAGGTCLTLRERQVLQLVCERHINREIADILNISIKTVEKHRASMKSKLNVSNTQELIDYWHNKPQSPAPSSPRKMNQIGQVSTVNLSYSA